MKMMNMKHSKKESKEMATHAEMDAPEYPYGLCLSLEKEEIAKLGLGTPKAGTRLMLHAMVDVKSVTVSDQADGKGYKSMSLQITDMALEKPGMDMKETAKALYGKG
ncbi:MAG: hypothetical protein M0T69_01970 [Deltaproteobacteria bacterium]|nr:hypothetical protein [Deltaproteobacteria bacterium]